MKNYFIIHGSFGDSKEHWIPWLKNKLESVGYDIFTPDFPIGKNKHILLGQKN